MIYLFDNGENLLHIFSKSDFVSFRHVKTINKFDEAKFELPARNDFKVFFESAVYFAFFDNDIFRVMKITSFVVSDTLEISGIDRAEYDLRTVSVIKNRRFKNADVSSVLSAVCDNSLFSTGLVSGISRTASLSFYYVSPMEALVKLCEVFSCEFVIRYSFVNNRIVSRYIDLYKRQGRVSGKQFYHGSDLLKLKFEQSNDEIVTALVGRGKGEETENGGYGRRIEFNVDGKNYVTKDDLLETYGIFKNGSYHHRFDVFVDENIEDRQELLIATREELDRRSRPKVVYEADVLDVGLDLMLGDSVVIIRDDLNISFMARVFEMSIDKLNGDRSTLKLGDYDVLQNPTLKKVQSATKSLMEENSSATYEAFNEKIEQLKENFKVEFDEEQRLFSLELDNKILSAKNEANVFAAALVAEVDDKITNFDTSRLQDEFNRSLVASRDEFRRLIPDLSGLQSQLSGVSTTVSGLVSSQDELSRRFSSFSVGGRNYYLGTRNFSTNKWVNRGNLIAQAGRFRDLSIFKVKAAWNGACQNIETKSGDFWTFSFFARADADGVRACIYTFKAPAAAPSPDFKPIVLTTEWQRFFITFTCSRDSNICPRVEALSNSALFYVAGFKLERGSILTDWSPAPEDGDSFVTAKLAEYKQSVDGQFAQVSGLLDNGTAKVSSLEQSLSGISQSVSSLQGEVLKKSEVSISDTSISLGAGMVVDGNRLASMISVSPDAVSAITDRFVIKPSNENLVNDSYLFNGVSTLYTAYLESNARNVWVSSNYTFNPVGLEFLVRWRRIADASASGRIPENDNKQNLYVMFRVEFSNGFVWYPNQLLISSDASVSVNGSLSFRLVMPPHVIDRTQGASFVNFRIGVQQYSASDYQLWIVEGLEVYLKKSAEFLVDGSITAKHIASNSIETGNIKAGAIVSRHIASGAVEADNIKAGAIGADKLVVDKALIDKLNTNNLLANYIKTVELNATKITSGVISGDRISGGTITGTILSGTAINGGTITGAIIQGNSKIKIGQYGVLQPADETLQICVPEAIGSKRGIGIQIKGGYDGRVPYGMFIYPDRDITTGDTSEHTDANILHVQGFMDVKGIDNLVIKKYSDGENSLHLWDTGSDPVELLFERSPERDISLYWKNNSGRVEKYSLYYGLKAANSDIRLKENVVDCRDSALSLVEQLKFKSFDWRDLGRGKDKSTKFGLIAQDVMELDDSLVRKNGEYYALEDFRLLNIALKSIQELNSEIKLLKEKLYDRGIAS